MTKRNQPQPCQRCGTIFVRTRRHNTPHCSTLCRFMVKINKTEDCWIWTGAQDGHGYGQINIDRVPVKAYRWAWENIGGNTPTSGLFLDHLCRNRLCVNPDHLEEVTNRENCLRGQAPSVVTHVTGICQRGHSMDDAIIHPDGSRACRKCENAAQRRRYRNRKSAA